MRCREIDVNKFVWKCSGIFSLLVAVLMSCSANSVTEEPPVRNVLILGNSITHHGPQPSIGWYGDWGMAASAKEKDFVHLLEKQFLSRSPATKLTYASIAGTFERKFWSIDTSDFSKFKSVKPDLIILKIGENISDSLAVSQSLESHLRELVGYLKGDNQPTICVTGSFWPNKNINRILQTACTKNGWIYVSLDGLFKEGGENTGAAFFANTGVALHPSDLGMQNIADRIWSQVNFLFPAGKEN